MNIACKYPVRQDANFKCKLSKAQVLSMRSNVFLNKAIQVLLDIWGWLLNLNSCGAE